MTTRKTDTDIHRLVRKLLDELGVTYIEEYPLPPYRLDFFLTECNLGVEADSEYWHSEKKDRQRDLLIYDVYAVKIIRCGYNITLDMLRELIEENCK